MRFLPPRRWLRFSLRTLLVATTITAVVAGYWAYRSENQRALMDQLRAHEYAVTYDTISNSRGWRARLGEWIGLDYVSWPWALVNNHDPREFHGDLDLIAQLPSVVKLELSISEVNDDDLKLIADLPHVDMLGLRFTQVTDAGLEHITRLPLVALQLGGLKLTDACIEPLSRIKTLKEVHLPKGSISQAAIERLREALPTCDVQVDN